MALFECALKIAEAEASQTVYANLEIGAEGSLRSFEAALQDHGFIQSYAMMRMRRAGASYIAPSVGASWRWQDLAQETVLPARHLLMAAFANIPGMNFRREDIEDARSWKTTPPVRLLFDDDKLAGYVGVLLEPDGAGMVNVIARHPRYKGQDVGAVLMNEALKLLAEHDCNPIHLNVMAKNEHALGLYENFGFTIAYVVPIYSLSLRQPHASP